MSHKTKQQRQQEAKERNRSCLRQHELNLRDAVEYEMRNLGDSFASRDVDTKVKTLKRLYAECGYEPIVANGVINAILESRSLGAWLSSSVKHDTIVRRRS